MDPFALLSNVVSKNAWVLLYLIPAVLFALVVKTPWFKGVFGEFMVNLYIRFMLDQSQYHLIKNVTLPTEDGTTQVDHVIVSEFGVFVLETKSMKGWIFGTENQGQWTQKIFKQSYKFQNPLRQNYKHLKTLELLLDLNMNQLHSVIVFVGSCVLKNELPSHVTMGAGCIRYIQSKTVKVLSKADVSQCIQKIETGRLVRSFKTNRDHVRHVKDLVARKNKPVVNVGTDTSIVAAPQTRIQTATETVDVSLQANMDARNNPICPRCGGATFFREPRKHQPANVTVYACGKFPQCLGLVVV